MIQAENRAIAQMLYRSLLLLLLLCSPSLVAAQSGVLIPANLEKPDPNVLTLDEMSVKISIDNQFARVRVVQIFGNHTATVQEGKYIFLIPTTASIADFAVWDGDVRIPGVILEARRADEIYKDIALQAIDPGIVQQADEDEGRDRHKVRSGWS